MSRLTSLDDTIVAIASAAGGGERGIVRLSGPEALVCVARFCEPVAGEALAARQGAQVVRSRLTLPDFFEPVAALVYMWPTARSYTRQPTVEVHTHGSPPLLAAVVEAATHAGARLAGPGEFTLRAFLAGRLDLTQAEAVLGVIDAHSQRQLQTALAQLAGGLAGPLHALRESLLGALAHLEAGLDFVNEDIEFITAAELAAQLATAHEEITALLGRMRQRSAGVERVRIVLCGAPNVGKSSLFNALVEQSRALVADQAGTTRDYLTATLDLDGLTLELLDTAGLLEHTTTGIEHAAQQAATIQQASADIECFCLDSTRELTAWERTRLAQPVASRIIVWTKADALKTPLPLGEGGSRSEPGEGGGEMQNERQEQDISREPSSGPAGHLLPEGEGLEGILTSSATGAWLDTLRHALRAAALATLSADSDVVPATAARTQASLEAAAAALLRGQLLVAYNGGHELVAIELRTALDALGEVVGAIYTDDILDRIFSRFCIGK